MTDLRATATIAMHIEVPSSGVLGWCGKIYLLTNKTVNLQYFPKYYSNHIASGNHLRLKLKQNGQFLINIEVLLFFCKGLKCKLLIQKSQEIENIHTNTNV